jgi:hypothetical protein
VNEERADAVRLGRSQKLRLTAPGREAVDAHQLMVEQARSGTGRAGFEANRSAWANPRGINVEDGLFLVEFAGGERTHQEVARAIERCGASAAEVKKGVLRLLAGGFLEAVPAVAAPPPRNSYRY